MTTKLEKLLESNKNLVLGKLGCRFCQKAVDLLLSKCMDFLYIFNENNKDVDKDVKMLRQGLTDANKRAHTYPAVFIDGAYVGGFTELNKLMS